MPVLLNTATNLIMMYAKINAEDWEEDRTSCQNASV